MQSCASDHQHHSSASIGRIARNIAYVQVTRLNRFQRVYAGSAVQTQHRNSSPGRVAAPLKNEAKERCLKIIRRSQTTKMPFETLASNKGC